MIGLPRPFIQASIVKLVVVPNVRLGPWVTLTRCPKEKFNPLPTNPGNDLIPPDPIALLAVPTLLKGLRSATVTPDLSSIGHQPTMPEGGGTQEHGKPTVTLSLCVVPIVFPIVV